jgi:glycosyltransferase involved in cell wall biosynthesis
VLLEGMAVGKPLVASNGGGVPEIVVDGVTGLLFEPKNAAALAACLGELLADPARARMLGSAGRQRLEADFSITSNVAQTEALYTTLLAR